MEGGRKEGGERACQSSCCFISLTYKLKVCLNRMFCWD